jgi:hypothetical protein
MALGLSFLKDKNVKNSYGVEAAVMKAEKFSLSEGH